MGKASGEFLIVDVAEFSQAREGLFDGFGLGFFKQTLAQFGYAARFRGQQAEGAGQRLFIGRLRFGRGSNSLVRDLWRSEKIPGFQDRACRLRAAWYFQDR